MHSKINIRLTNRAVMVAAATLFFFASCTERYVGVGENVQTSSLVYVPVQWSDPSADTLGLMPAGMKYIFLPGQTSGAETPPSVFGVISTGFYRYFRSVLPVGNYSLLAYTSGVAGLTPVDDMQFDKAAVHATPIYQDGGEAENENLVAPCGRFWVASFDNLKVSGAIPAITAAVTPRALTSQIRLHILNNTGLSIDSISGMFRGLVLSRLLHNGLPDASLTRGTYAFGSTPSEGAAPHTAFTSVFRTLGVYDPLSVTQPYNNMLTLTAWQDHKKQMVIHINISANLHDALALASADASAGLDTAIELRVLLEGLSDKVEATVTVKAWENGGEIWQDI